jgi:hypothetical protein
MLYVEQEPSEHSCERQEACESVCRHEVPLSGCTTLQGSRLHRAVFDFEKEISGPQSASRLALLDP